MTYLINPKTFYDYEDISENVKPERLLVFVKKAMDLDLRQFMRKAFYDDFIKNFSNVFGINSLNITSSATTVTQGNYNNQALLGGSGTGATASFQVLNGRVMKATIVSAGTGYEIDDVLTCGAIPNGVFTVKDQSVELSIAGGISQAYSDLFQGKIYTDKQGHNIIYPGIIPALVYWTFARFIEGDGFRFTSTGVVNKNHDDATALSQKDIASLVAQQRSVANAKANDIEEFLYNNKTDYPLWRYNERNKNSRQPGGRIRGIDRTQYNRADIYGEYDMIYGGTTNTNNVAKQEIRLPFANVSSVTINWRTDVPPGFSQPYGILLGDNKPTPTVDIATGNPNEEQSADFDLKYTRIGGVLQTVTIDFGVSQTGTIVF